MPSGRTDTTEDWGRTKGPQNARRVPARRTSVVTPMRARPANILTLLSLPAMAAAVAPWLAGAHWTIDLLACFATQAFVCLLALAALLAATKNFRLAGVVATGSLSAGVACALAISDGAIAAASRDGAQPSLRVMSANLLFGNEAGAGHLLRTLREHDPDVLFFSEVTSAWLAALDAPLRDYPFRCSRTGEGPFGVALLSRLPLQQAEVLPMGYAWAPAIRAIVQTANGPVGLLGVHPPRPGGAERNAERDRALAALPALLTALPPRRVVLGDCNATPFNPSFRAMLSATGLRNAAGNRWLPTWPQQLVWPLRIPIDHVLIDAAVRVQSIEVGPSFGSDHAPLFAALAW